jgi:hypothetical protein
MTMVVSQPRITFGEDDRAKNLHPKGK